ncbi:MAG: ATP-dependent protease ATPase subunit HslU [bacterium]
MATELERTKLLSAVEQADREEDLTPKRIVEHLDKYIVGQDQAKRLVAIALRNRYRRSLLAEDMKEEVIPKNIIMIGPTGVGKTEIARRLANLVEAPFIKVEATKYTEVGYVGRDVESMIRDLVESGVRMVKERMRKEVEKKAEEAAVEKILDTLHALPDTHTGVTAAGATVESVGETTPSQSQRVRDRLRKKIEKGELDGFMLEIETSDSSPKMVEIFTSAGIEEMGVNIQDMLGNMFPKKTKKKKLPISEAKRILENQEVEKLIDMERAVQDAINLVEQSGIVFIDELDKIVGREKQGSGPDVSREGVQRDILPIVEGSTVITKYGPVRTNHILFMAAGAFHASKPSDLIPELQGRFPLRVELDSLTKDDFKRILVEPRNALVKQYVALMEADGVELKFTEDGVDAIAENACIVNERTENIGARRLHTVLEKILEEVSFAAPDDFSGSIVVDADYVTKWLKDIVKDVDLSRYIL